MGVVRVRVVGEGEGMQSEGAAGEDDYGIDRHAGWGGDEPVLWELGPLAHTPCKKKAACERGSSPFCVVATACAQEQEQGHRYVSTE